MDRTMSDQLISYWRGDQGLDEESRLRCLWLAQELARCFPAALLQVVRDDPERRRLEIEQMIADIAMPERSDAAALRGPEERRSRLASPSSSIDDRFTRPADPPVGIRQEASGDGFTMIGNVAGSVHMRAQPQPKASPQDRPIPTPSARAQEKIRILFLSAQPSDLDPLRLEHEVREIDQALLSAELGNRFDLLTKGALRVQDLQTHLLRYRPHILHFSGHGGRARGLFFEDDKGRSRPVEGVRIARLLGQFNQHLRCVVLNACFSEEQGRAIAEQVDCVIGMATAVQDRAAIRLAARFYQALAHGLNVRAAYDLSRADIEVNEFGQENVAQLLAIRRDPETILFTEMSP